MPEQDTIVCPDCGAAYQCSAEQLGKLLHCKCGRYLVAGGTNHKSEPVPRAAVAAVTPQKSELSFGIKTSSEQSFGIKAPVSVPKANPASAEAVYEPPSARENEESNSGKSVYIAAAVVAVALLGFGIYLFRPAAKANVVPPAPMQTTVHAAVSTDPCAVTPIRLDNGALVERSFVGNGMGKLEIENAMPSDVAVRLIGTANVTVAWVYVQQGEQVVVNNLPFGTYKALIASGSNWNARTHTFQCDDAYAEFEKPLEYMDRREDDRTVYSMYKLTLGKQRTAMIAKDEFFKGYIGGN